MLYSSICLKELERKVCQSAILFMDAFILFKTFPTTFLEHFQEQVIYPSSPLSFTYFSWGHNCAFVL